MKTVEHLIVIIAIFSVTCLTSLSSIADVKEDRETKVRNDRKQIQAQQFWIYNDLKKATELAKKSSKPLLVVFRCIPCEACSGFDAKVANLDPGIQDLLKQYVCVRIIQANGMDLSLFKFDYDLSFAAFIMNADKTIYGRFGTRSELKDTERDISIEGFHKALAAGLRLHKAYPANKNLFVGKIGPAPKIKRPELLKTWQGKFHPMIDWRGKVVPSCLHCHQIRDAQRKELRNARQIIPDKVLHPWPMPSVIGLNLNPKELATITKVKPNSPAAKAELQVGDQINTLNGQAILSIADVQWILHEAKNSDAIKASIIRDSKKLDLTIKLASGWRKQSDISWRVTTWDLRRMSTGGMVLHPTTATQRKQNKLRDDQLALYVNYVGRYGEHAVAKKAGFKKGDIIVAFDGKTQAMTETDLISHIVNKRLPGSKVPVTVIRKGKRINMMLKMQ
jgi:serine protease Do